jgi:hypothetical protein
MAQVTPAFEPLLIGCKANRDNWQSLATELTVNKSVENENEKNRVTNDSVSDPENNRTAQERAGISSGDITLSDAGEYAQQLDNKDLEFQESSSGDTTRTS